MVYFLKKSLFYISSCCSSSKKKRVWLSSSWKIIIYILILKCSKSLKEWQKIFKINLKRIKISSSSWTQLELGSFSARAGSFMKIFFWPYSCKAYSIYSKKNISDLSIMILGYFLAIEARLKNPKTKSTHRILFSKTYYWRAHVI